MQPWKPKLVKSSPERVSPAEPVIPNPGAVDPVAAPRVELTAWKEDRQLSFYVLLILTAGVLYLTYIVFRPFLGALFVTLIMAIAFFPLYSWFARRFRSTFFAALTTSAMTLLLIAVPFVLISGKIAVEARGIYSSVLQLGDPATWPRPLDPLIQQAAHQTGIPAEQLRADIMRRARQLGPWLLGTATSFARRFAEEMMTLGLATVFLFFLLQSSDEFRLGALSMLPLSRNRTRELAIAVNQSVIADIYGMVAVGVAEGILITIGFWMTGVPSPLLLGTLAIFLSCLPFVGVSLVWIPACIFLALRGNLTNAGLLLVWCVIVVSLAEGVIRPRVVSGRVRVNEMLITISIMGGVVAFGPIGIFAGPVVLVLAVTLARILREEHSTAEAVRIRA